MLRLQSKDMSDFDDDDFSLGEDSQDEQSGDTEEENDDFTLASDDSNFEELNPKPKKARIAPKKSLESPLPNRKTSSTNALVVQMKSPSCSAKSPIAPKAMKAEEAEAAVLDYMHKANRPYSVLNVFENMHRVIAKPSLTKLLDNLVVKEELMSKTYGKAKIYYMNQNHLAVPSENERHAVEERIQTITAECATLQQELKSAETTLSTVTSQISDEDLDAALKQLEETAATLEKKVEALDQPDRVAVSPHMKDTLQRKFVKYHTAWVARKRIAMDGINQIADGMEKKVAVVLDLVGLETDEEVGIKTLPTI